MAEGQSKPPTPSWGKKRWHGDGAAPGAPPSHRKRNAILVLAAILALAGAVVALVFFLKGHESPFILTISISEYESWPPNPLADQDSEALLPFFAKDRQIRSLGAQQRDRLLEELGKLRDRNDEAVVVYLRAHAISRNDKLYILPANARLDDPTTWVYFDEVLSRVKACPAKHRLLILDIAHPILGARIGVLTDDVAGRLQALLKDDDSGLLVMCPCASGQTSLIGEDMGVSVFAWYLRLGLSGQCDGVGRNGKHDDRLTVFELFDYVRPRVDRWARENRGVRQTPLLLGTGADFTLAQGHTTVPTDLLDSPPYPNFLQSRWKQRDDWFKNGDYRRAPGAFRAAEAAILRAEQRWRSGADPARIESSLTDDLKQYERQLSNAAEAKRIDFPAQSVQTGAHADSAQRDALRKYLGLLNQVPPAKPADMESARKEFLEKHAGKPPFDDLALSAFDILAGESAPGPERFAAVSQLLRSLQPAPRFVETILIQRLGSWPPEIPWPAALVPKLLDAVREQEKTSAGDPATLVWFTKDLEEAVRHRRDGERLLFEGDAAAWADAKKNLDDAISRFQKIQEQVEAIRKAKLLCDEALAVLPGTEPYLADNSRFEARDEREWNSALRGATRLYALLSEPPDGHPPGRDDLNQCEEDLGSLERLRQPFQKQQIDQLIGRLGRGGPDDLSDVEARLASPLLSGPLRQGLEDARRKLARRLEAATIEHDRGAVDTMPDEDNKAGAAADAQAGRRARPSIDLLALAGVKTTNLDELWKRTRDKPSPAGWQELGDKLRAAWADLPGQLTRQTKEKNWSAADRLSRLVDRPEMKEVTIPVVELHRLRVQHYFAWLEKYYHDEAARFPRPDQKEWHDFYEDAERACRRVMK